MFTVSSPSLALVVSVVATSLIVLVRYFVVSGFFALWTKVRVPGLYQGLEKQIAREMSWSAIAAIIYGVPFGVVLWLWAAHGQTKIYIDPDAFPLWWFPLSVLLYLLLHDAWFYWTHRLMHAPRIYRACHFVHHQSHPPTAWAAMSFHPYEAVSGAVFIPLLALLVPIHIAALALVVLTMTVFGVTNHLSWEIWPSKIVEGPIGTIIITASHHDQHHRRSSCNYGLYFRFWDYICGTDRGFSTFGGEPVHCAGGRYLDRERVKSRTLRPQG
jgi:lathosterol oxidase